MHNGILMAVLDKGGKLVMTDGTIWVVNPKDIEQASEWVPPVVVSIDEKSDHKEYDYTLTNTESEVTLTALRRR
ncbi:MAG: hypothetical protein KFF73_18965 [Cyclobacteriaceae bacterium]|nr:hypothetical protein [Cyclobacteriaceae bacterium]